MSLSHTISHPIYLGGTTSSDVPYKFPVALAGRGFMLDMASNENFFETIDTIREQADTGNRPGEQTINPAGLWRRAQQDWTLGAGQVFQDREGSSERRFRTSKGINIWEKWQIGLLNGTERVLESSATNLLGVTAGNRYYTLDGSTIKYTTDLVDWDEVTDGPVPAPTSIASDGFHVWTAHAASGVYLTDSSATATAAYNALQAEVLAFVKGRLMAAKDNAIYNITSGSVPSALFTHFNSAFQFIDFAEGPTHIYAAGYSGDKSEIYKVGIKQDGSGLDSGSVAGELPDGEVITSIEGYVGRFLLIGTTLGWRVALIEGDGNLNMGSPVFTGVPTYAFEPQAEFVWFGWSNYDSLSTGLGRLNLAESVSESNVPLPPYASDLMVTGQGEVKSITTFNNMRVFSVSGLGVYTETEELVETGTLDTGFITYNLPERKVALYLDVRHKGTLNGFYTVHLSVDGGSFTQVGARTLGTLNQSEAFPVSQRKGETFEVRIELNRDEDDETLGPTLDRYTLLSNPTTTVGVIIQQAFLIATTYSLADSDEPRDVADDLSFIMALHLAKSVINYQIGLSTYSVIVEKFRWIPHAELDDHSAYSGTCVVRMKSIE